jgi:Fe-S cluster assembly protein SufD
VKELEGAATIVFVDGSFHQTVNIPDSSGLTLLTFKEAINRRLVHLKDYLISYPDTVSAFESLNTAFMNDGVYLSVEADTVLEKPIRILHIATDANEQHGWHSRNLLVFGRNSKSAVLEQYVSLSAQKNYLANTVSQTVLDTGATVEYTRIQNEAASAFHFAVNRAVLAENSKLTVHSHDLGGKLTRYNLNVELNGRNASCHTNGLFMVNEQRQADNYLLVEHEVPDCQSESFFRGVLDNRGKGVFRGKIQVHPDAQRTNAQLNNANLLLSNDAEIDTMPQLEIYADDVKCNHGSSSGQLDEEQLFYLTSRGVDKEAAHNLLVYAFANSVIDQIESAKIKELVKKQMLAKLATDSDLMELVR